MNLCQFAERLERATVEKQARVLLRDFLLSFGIKHFAFTYYSGHIKTGRKLRYDCSSETIRSWHTHYLSQGYADVDRTLEASHLTTLPLFWDITQQLNAAKNNRERRIRQESLDFGIAKGLSIPVHGPHHDYASLTLFQMRNEEGLQDYERQQFLWLSGAQIFYHHIKKLLNLQEAPVYQLTRREEQCLFYTAQMWRVEQIAAELEISPRTVNFHIQNANKKLGTNNKYQAIYIVEMGNGVKC